MCIPDSKRYLIGFRHFEVVSLGGEGQGKEGGWMVTLDYFQRKPPLNLTHL